ncbi:MAG: methyltransferase domain-containing protein [Candidatus Marithrix sp.]|nr:methyltransferase domain-containing protein [Candidatus Marithrix sp.]
MNFYDEIPYTKLIYQQTQPDCIATTITLFGMLPPSVANSRVLELGCASGINTIAMAQAIPDGEFIGIDYSKTQIAEGQANIHKLGLKNITLQAMDFSDISLGQFDYIVVHGVYSWIPKNLQVKLLEICKQHLQPNGVVYISYNTYPGWHTDHMLRKMMLYRTKHLSTTQEKLAQAKELLKFFMEVNKQKFDSYSLSLRKELEYVSKLADNYLVHEYLEEYNEPILFSDFIEQANQNGLQYITDMRTPFVATENFALHGSFDLIETEQYLDFLRNTSFRETLLCHQDVVLDRNLSKDRIDNLYIAAPLKMSVKTEDIKPDEVLTKFSNLAGETVLSITSPLLKAVCLCLGETWPRSVSFKDLMRQVSDLLSMMDTKITVSPTDIDEIKTMLVEFYLKKIVELSVYPPKFTLNISEFPLASPIARLQSQNDKQVTNLRYEIFTLDLATRNILQHLDGKHNTDLLLKIMQESIDNGDLILYQGNDKKDITKIDSEQIQSYLTNYVTTILQDLANKAYLIA